MENQKNHLSRRDFLKILGLGMATSLVFSIGINPDNLESQKTQSENEPDPNKKRKLWFCKERKQSSPKPNNR